VPHSCGHRRGPPGQHHESQPWLERPLQKWVPGTYFLLTFTRPAELSALAFGHQRTLYTLMSPCAWQTVPSFAHHDKPRQGEPGAIAVRQTHSRALDDHPHAHWAVPAAAIDAEKRRWRTQKGYLFNHKALAKVFRAKRLAAIAAEGLAWPPRGPEQGVVDGKGVGSGAKALGYLGRYRYRGVIREKDILSGEKGPVTFRYPNAKTQRTEIRTVSGARFLGLILPHVLPKGFRRARHFGFRHPHSKRRLAWLQYLRGLDGQGALAWIKPRPRRSCPGCGGDMKMIKTRLSLPLSGAPLVPIGDRAGASAR